MPRCKHTEVALIASRNDGTTTPGRRRLRPLVRSAVAGPGAHRTHDAPRRARLGGHQVQLVLARASVECPRKRSPTRRSEPRWSSSPTGSSSRWTGRATGSDKVHLVGHSLVGRYRAGHRGGRLTGWSTPSSPWRHLSEVRRWCTCCRWGRFVRGAEDSPLLRRLACAPVRTVAGIHGRARHDRRGLRSVPAHTQAETVTVGGVGHNGMLLSREVVGLIAPCPHEAGPDPSIPVGTSPEHTQKVS